MRNRIPALRTAFHRLPCRNLVAPRYDRLAGCGAREETCRKCCTCCRPLVWTRPRISSILLRLRSAAFPDCNLSLSRLGCGTLANHIVSAVAHSMAPTHPSARCLMTRYRLRLKALLVVLLGVAVHFSAPKANAAPTSGGDGCSWCADSCWTAGFACVIGCGATGNGCYSNCIAVDGTPYPVGVNCG